MHFTFSKIHKYKYEYINNKFNIDGVVFASMNMSGFILSLEIHYNQNKALEG